MYSKTGEVKFSHMERACAAIQDQPREVRAAWNLSEEVTIEPCRRPSDLEGISYASISAEPNFLSAFRAPAEGDGSNATDRQLSREHGAIGGRAHGADDPGRPYAQVRYVEDRPEDHRWWTVTLSHECIEMAVNPYMDRTLKASPLPDFAASGRVGKHEEVHYLKEICDPCQSGWHAYPCERPGSDQPVWLSDFLLPDYFDWQPRGSRFSFTGSVTRPFEILTHGCLSWGVPRTKRLWQQWRFDDGKLSDFVCVRDWEPTLEDSRDVAPRANDERNKARQSLYAAQPDYKKHRVPHPNRVADALRRRKPS